LPSLAHWLAPVPPLLLFHVQQEEEAYVLGASAHALKASQKAKVIG